MCAVTKLRVAVARWGHHGPVLRVADVFSDKYGLHTGTHEHNQINNRSIIVDHYIDSTLSRRSQDLGLRPFPIHFCPQHSYSHWYSHSQCNKNAYLLRCWIWDWSLFVAERMDDSIQWSGSEGCFSPINLLATTILWWRSLFQVVLSIKYSRLSMWQTVSSNYLNRLAKRFTIDNTDHEHYCGTREAINTRPTATKIKTRLNRI